MSSVGSCARCEGIDADRASELGVVGGSIDPFNEPWGELRTCPSCGAWFRYDRDHDNAIGYEAAPPALVRLDVAGARRLAEDAVVVAQRLLAYFAPLDDPWSRSCAVGYEAELARLARALEVLGEEG